LDFCASFFHDLERAATVIGSDGLGRHQKGNILNLLEETQAQRVENLGSGVRDFFGIDITDTLYQSYRNRTNMGLEVGTLVLGGYGAVKGVIGFSKLAKIPAKMTKLGTKGLHSFEKLLQVGDFRYSKTATKHFTELVKRGPNAGKLSRPYMKSPHTINEIMAAKKPIPDPGGLAGGLR